MAITLSNYQPLDFTRSLLTLHTKQGTGNWCEIAKKVGLIVLTIIALLPTLILDGLFCIGRAICKPATPPPSPTIPHPPAAPPSPVVRRLPSSSLTDTDFFKDAMENAIASFDAKEGLLCQQLLKNHGTLDDLDSEAQHPISNVYSWSAECLIIHGLLHGRVIEGLSKTWPKGFDDLSRADRDTIVLQIRNHKEKNILSESGEKFLKELRAEASEATQKKTFIKLYCDIYPV